jgi:uncharacterized membrane protein YdbT with pleckstrin-like domain
MILLREEEKIHLVKRRHGLILIRDVFGVVLILFSILIGVFVVFFSSFTFPESLTDSFPILLSYKAPIFIIYLLSLLMLFIWQIIFIIFADYYLDCWIITDQRTIHTEINSLFNRVLSSIQHDKIQDVTVTVNGIIPTFFKYGDLQIQTAGKFHEFVFRQIPEPYETKEKIFEVQKDYLKKLNKN